MALRDLPHGGTPADTTEYDEALSSGHWPGGKILFPHRNDGPWYIVVVRDADAPEWLPAAAMRAYPGVLATWVDDNVDGDVLLFAVPALARDFMNWFNDPEHGDFHADFEYEQGPFDTQPGPEQWGTALTDCTIGLGPGYDTAVTAMTQAVQAMGVHATAAFLRQLSEDILTDPGALTTALSGTLAPAVRDAR